MSVWRYLSGDGVDAADGLAADEAMMLPCGRARAAPRPTLRLYSYRPHCALVGRYQSLGDEVDLAYCEGHDIQVGRRPTGGGAILMGPGQLGVALAARAVPEEAPRDALRRYSEGVIAGLAELRVEAHFRSKNDLEVGGRKIAGLGLYIDPEGALLFHASVLVDLDVELLLQVLRIPGAKLQDKAAARVEERVTTVSRELGKTLQAADVREAFRAGFGRTLEVDLEAGRLSEAEEARGRDLVASRYGSHEWIHQRSPRRDAKGSAVMKTPEGLLRIFVGVHGEAIKSALVTGDFNVMPPGIPRLEAALRWCAADPARVRAAVAEAVGRDELGVAPEALAAVVWAAVAQALAREQAGHPVRAQGSCYFPDPSENPGGAPHAKKDRT